MKRSAFRPDLRVLQELRETPASSRAETSRQRAAPRRPPPSTARMPQFLLPGNSAAAMRQKLAGVKVDSEGLDAKMAALFGEARTQKARTRHTAHQRDWLQAGLELQKERAEAERAIAMHRHVHAAGKAGKAAAEGTEGGGAASSTCGGGGGGDGVDAQLAALWSGEAEADAARREWSFEMRSQLTDMRELCDATRQARSPPELTRQLLGEVRESLATQAQLLQAKAEALEAELAGHMALVHADDDDAPPPPHDDDKPEVHAIAQLSSAFIAPRELRTAGEQRLLERLGAEFAAEELARKRALDALGEEFADVRGARALQVAGEYFVLPADEAEEGGDDARPASASTRGGGGGGAELDGAVIARLQKLEKEFRGRPRAQLVERARLELPAACVEEHLQHLSRRRGFSGRRKALLAAWEARKAELGRQARQLLQEQAAAEGREAVHRGQAELLEAHRQQLQAELELLARARAERDAVEEEERREAAAVQKKLEEARQARAEADRAHKKALIEQYRHEKSKVDELEAAKALAAALAEEQERLKQAEYNLQRVQFRAEQLHQRKVLREAQREQDRLEEEEAKARLQRVRERTVAALGVTADPERATGATAASMAVNQPKVELFRVQGYSEEVLMKDMRYKLGIALSNAGLRQTEYGRMMLTSDRLGGALRPDAIESTIKLG
ncbi:hypothetical protein AB1Y20_020133 [Prymnesium parvum]|uniref:Coiled-coil domain-containing protein 148 n=1 Tax=Prymnesium parvum TaxID=97485 RepID=A0AB34JW86_PRYPA